MLDVLPVGYEVTHVSPARCVLNEQRKSTGSRVVPPDHFHAAPRSFPAACGSTSPREPQNLRTSNPLHGYVLQRREVGPSGSDALINGAVLAHGESWLSSNAIPRADPNPGKSSPAEGRGLAFGPYSGRARGSSEQPNRIQVKKKQAIGRAMNRPCIMGILQARYSIQRSTYHQIEWCLRGRSMWAGSTGCIRRATA